MGSKAKTPWRLGKSSGNVPGVDIFHSQHSRLWLVVLIDCMYCPDHASEGS